ncbi:hypothetical protein E2562_031633 [Oryza meyeriana var. granulata]|uniref:Uncharacterized protein n=1 Tax=Oryza meyeriana var. granulata TaxID=110450 RepID=A0A6G1D9Q9_9ORYZ|nr:hypothetical protein E2562_031633 [Oryza meyeriana var. granulata]
MAWRRPAERCFSVYVGVRQQRFIVRMESMNYLLFRALLEEAFGYAAVGPLQLPCDAAVFVRVLEQIEEEAASPEGTPPAGCSSLAGRCGDRS